MRMYALVLVSSKKRDDNEVTEQDHTHSLSLSLSGRVSWAHPGPTAPALQRLTTAEPVSNFIYPLTDPHLHLSLSCLKFDARAQS